MRLCFIDTETTGLYPCTGDRICEIALIKISANLQVIDQFETLINPLREISPTAYKVNRIAKSELDKAPEFSELAEFINNFIGDCNLVGHNVAFDYDFLKNELDLVGQICNIPYTFDTREITSSLIHSSSYGLSTLIGIFGLKIQNRHRAMGDCRATLDVFRAVYEKYNRETGNTLDSMLEKFARKTTADNMDLPPALEKALERHLALHIEYRNRENYHSDRIIQPLRAFSSRGKTYIQAFCHSKKENRTFLLDRIKIISDP